MDWDRTQSPLLSGREGAHFHTVLPKSVLKEAYRRAVFVSERITKLQ